MSQPLALILDDEPDIRELLEITLARMDIDTRSAANLKAARDLLAAQHFDLCLTDMRLPDGDGLELVRHIQQHHNDTPVAVITAHGSMETAVEALKAGAFDFVSKPVDLHVLRNLITTALRLTVTTQGEDRRSRTVLLGESPAMRSIRGTIVKLARSQAPVYVSGESGTGKELVARLIHQKGPRSERAFIPVNCGAIPADLMESELFGHRKGSFTGAINDKQGLFQAADGGTLFLDEVADLPLHMQVKLLRAIQEKSVRPVGDSQEISVDVRILCATHKNLAELTARGDFRQDLFYRLNVIELNVPPLRERREDIVPLASALLTRLTGPDSGPPPTLDAEAQRALENYDFPGNVRELENILERAITLGDGQRIGAADLQLPQTRQAAGDADDPLDQYLGEKEKEAIVRALEETHWNKTAAAKKLGITFRALRYRLKKLGLE